jgi:hypothetical protein
MFVQLVDRPTVDASPRRAEAPDRREICVAALVAFVPSCVYLVIAWTHGAIGVARNDDWSYYHVAYRLATHGVFRLDGWVETLFVGQALLAWPIIKIFGAVIAPLQITVAVLGAAGLWAAYLVIRSFLSRGWAACAVGCLALGPVYGSLSVSFMTDVPAFALQALALLAGLRAVRARAPSLPWFVTALGLGLAAFSIREYSIAAGLAVCLVALRRARSGDRQLTRRFVAAGSGWLVSVTALFLWRRGLANSISPRLDFSAAGIASSIGTAYLAALTLALFISPAVLVVSPVRLFRAAWTRSRRTSVIVICTAAAVAVAVVAIPREPFLGNYFGRSGSYVTSLPGAHLPILAGWMWEVLRFLGFASLIAIGLLTALQRAEPRHPAVVALAEQRSTASEGRALVGAFVAITIAVELLAILTTTAPFYDRYLIGLVPFVAALVVKSVFDRRCLAHRAGVRAAASLGVLCLIGLTFVDASATLDGAKWKLARAIEQRGFQPAAIDGGQEWFGYHQLDDIQQRPPEPGRSYWVTLFSERPTCVTLTLTGPEREGIPAAKGVPELIQHLKVRSLMGIEYRLDAIAGPQRCEPSTSGH